MSKSQTAKDFDLEIHNLLERICVKRLMLNDTHETFDERNRLDFLANNLTRLRNDFNSYCLLQEEEKTKPQ